MGCVRCAVKTPRWSAEVADVSFTATSRISPRIGRVTDPRASPGRSIAIPISDDTCWRPGTWHLETRSCRKLPWSGARRYTRHSGSASVAANGATATSTRDAACVSGPLADPIARDCPIKRGTSRSALFLRALESFPGISRIPTDPGK